MFTLTVEVGVFTKKIQWLFWRDNPVRKFIRERLLMEKRFHQTIQNCCDQFNNNSRPCFRRRGLKCDHVLSVYGLCLFHDASQSVGVLLSLRRHQHPACISTDGHLSWWVTTTIFLHSHWLKLLTSISILIGWCLCYHRNENIGNSRFFVSKTFMAPLVQNSKNFTLKKFLCKLFRSLSFE